MKAVFFLLALLLNGVHAQVLVATVSENKIGVEEQFYIIWPWLLAVVLKFCRNRTLLVLGFYAAASFVFSI